MRAYELIELANILDRQARRTDSLADLLFPTSPATAELRVNELDPLEAWERATAQAYANIATFIHSLVEVEEED